MRNDVKSNYTLAEAVAAKSWAHNVDHSSLGNGIIAGASVDHAGGSSASWLLTVGTVGASSTIDAKLQYSDNGTSWTDYSSSDGTGNSGAMTQKTAAGSAQLSVGVPLGRYSRILVTVAVAASVVAVVSVLGPKRHVAP